MKAVRVGEPGTVRVADVPEPRLHDPRDAIVKVTAAAICGADLFPVHGLTPGFDDATVLGHEFVGTVADVGPSVQSVRVGQRVVCSSMVSDGTCPHCRAGRPTQCERRSLFGYSGVYPRLDGAHFEHDYKLDAGLMFERELTLRFSIGDPVSDRERLMRMVLDGKLEPERVVSHRMALDDAAQAYQLFDKQIATKAVLYP